MCIQSKTWLLAVSLESDILSCVHDADEARQLLDEYVHNVDSTIAKMAKRYLRQRDAYHITETLGDAGTFTRLSLIRGAIRQVLDEYIRTKELGIVPVVPEPVFA